MVRDVGHLVGLRDRAVGTDQVAQALRELDLVGARVARLVRDADLLVPVGQQAEREVELLAERLVRVGRVEGDAEDLAVQCVEVSGLVTQAFPLDRSTRGVGHRVPPQQHPLAAQAGQRDVVAVLVGNREVGGGRTWLQHDGHANGSAGRVWRPCDRAGGTVTRDASVAEVADAPGLGPGVLRDVGVRVSPLARARPGCHVLVARPSNVYPKGFGSSAM